MAVLQAYIDDSASEIGDKRLVMAGFVSTASAWEKFSDAWEAALHAHPRIEYMHMVEAQNLSGEFLDWSESARDKKILSLSQVISPFVLFSVEVSVSRKAHERIIKPVAPYNMHNPFYVCFQTLVYTLPRFLHENQEYGSLPIDFIFDEHDLGPDALMWHPWLKDRMHEEVRNLLGGPPIFRDDKKVLPLQAADMLAWHLRRKAEGRDDFERPVYRILTRACPRVATELDEKRLMIQAYALRGVRGVERVQSKSEWRRLRGFIRTQMAAGMPPPPTNRLWMLGIDLAARLVRRWSRLRRRWQRK